jgi:glycosyltransferase involved in cell wall biosynthesis
MISPKLIRITTIPESLKTLLKGQLRFMCDNGIDIIGISSGGKALSEVKLEEGIEVHEIEMTRKITPIKDLIAVFKLFLFLKKTKPLIVHTHTPKAGTIGMIASKFAGVPHRLHTIAGLPLLEANGIKRKLLNFVEKLTYACATKVYPNSYGLKNIIIQEKFCEPHKLKIIANGSSNGIDTGYFNPTLFSISARLELKKKLNINPQDFIFIFVGRLVRDKGINELVKAFNDYNSYTSSSKLLLVGPYESELDPLERETLEIIENNSNIIYVGFQKDVRIYFSIANCLVFPSYREGFPNVVMQAGAMGLPSIVSDINGCNEIIQEGVNGTIVPVKNKEVIVEKMRELHENRSFYIQLQINARNMIIERFEQKTVWESLLVEYRSLLN